MVIHLPMQYQKNNKKKTEVPRAQTDKQLSPKSNTSEILWSYTYIMQYQKNN